jgi:hypothetical protein
MEQSNEINNDSDDNKDLNENEHDENNMIELERKNSNDNETNNILEKDENNNFGKKSNTNNEKKKKSFFHDKDITEDSIIYFSNKLKQSNSSYKTFLYISIVLHILNVVVCFLSKKIFNTFFNLFSILIILILVIYQIYTFRHNFEEISKEIYSLTQKVIYIYLSAVILFLINIFYLTFFKFLFFKDTKNNENNKNNQNNFLEEFQYNLIIAIYLLTNVAIPIILLFKLILVKKDIKNLSAAKGEIYESAKIEDVQIINSIINDS